MAGLALGQDRAGLRKAITPDSRVLGPETCDVCWVSVRATIVKGTAQAVRCKGGPLVRKAHAECPTPCPGKEGQGRCWSCWVSARSAAAPPPPSHGGTPASPSPPPTADSFPCLLPPSPQARRALPTSSGRAATPCGPRCPLTRSARRCRWVWVSGAEPRMCVMITVGRGTRSADSEQEAGGAMGGVQATEGASTSVQVVGMAWGRDARMGRKGGRVGR